MSQQHDDDPAHDASAKIASYVSVTAMAAQAIAQLAASRAQESAARDERAAGGVRAERQAGYGQARLAWAPILDDKLREQTSVVDAGTVWARAQAWRPDPEAERATHLAEERLRELRPDVMERYDRLRTAGAEPVEAMTRVAPYFDAPPTRTGDRGPDREALGQADAARREGDAEVARYRRGSAVPDNPRTVAVDEHAGAVVAAQPHLRHAAGHQDRAAALHHAAARTPASVAGEGYPTKLGAGTVATARTAATGQPVNITTLQQRSVAQRAAHISGRTR